MGEFDVYCISAEVINIVKDNKVIIKPLEHKKIVLNAILNLPSPNESLKRAQLNYKKIKEDKGFENNNATK